MEYWVVFFQCGRWMKIGPFVNDIKGALDWQAAQADLGAYITAGSM